MGRICDLNADLAQLVEHLSCKQRVGGSSPLISIGYLTPKLMIGIKNKPLFNWDLIPVFFIYITKICLVVNCLENFKQKLF